VKIPRDVNGSEAAKALGRLGFAVRRQAGSHLIMRKEQLSSEGVWLTNLNRRTTTRR